jgi:hypothetical protein
VDEIFQSAEEWFARRAIRFDNGNIILKCRPSGPNANPIESVALRLVEVFGDELIARAQRSVVTDAQKKHRAAIDRKTSGFDAKFSCVRWEEPAYIQEQERE